VSDDFFAWLATGEPELVEGGESEIVETPKTDLAPSVSGTDGLKLLRSRLLEGSMKVMDAVMAAADIDPEQKEPPEQWVNEYGRQEAERRFRVARYGLLPMKEVPSFIPLTQKTLLALTAQDAKGPQETHNTLNVALVSLTAPVPRELDE
jgi:hypothetical protein